LIPFARLRIERKAKLFAALKLVIVVLNVAMNIILVVQMRVGITGVFIAGCLSSFVGVLLFVPNICRNIRYGLNRKTLKELVSFGLPTVPSGFSAIILQVADRPILKALTDSTTVGMYNANIDLAFR
jgi:O-antigen/teichoic acid export membrane protein